MATRFDTRQTISRDALEQLAAATNTELDNILISIDSEVTSPLNMRESSTPDLVLNIGAISIANPETGRSRSITPMASVLPTFAGGTVTMSATGAGNATPSVGSALGLGMSANEFLKIGVSLNSSGDLVLTKGTAGASEAAATLPATVSGAHSIGYVVVETDGANNVQNIEKADIYQYFGSSSPAGSAAGDVTSASNITDNRMVRGDGGSKGVQESGIEVDDNDNLSGIQYVVHEQTPSSDITITTGNVGFHPLLTIDTGRTLTINSGGQFNTMDTLTNNGTITNNGTFYI